MSALEMSEPSPSFPLARCEAMGEGARRAGEGSLVAKDLFWKVFIPFKKEPSSGLLAFAKPRFCSGKADNFRFGGARSATFSHAAHGRRGTDEGSSVSFRSYIYGYPLT